jgi:hypothetical protein
MDHFSLSVDGTGNHREKTKGEVWFALIGNWAFHR